MSAVLQSLGLARPTFLPEGLALKFDWSWFSEWAFGLCTEWMQLGLITLALGPLHINLEWAIC